MWGTIFAAFVIVAAVARFTVMPLFQYFRDTKGFRKYPNMSLMSGITNLPYVLESCRGFRSKTLMELHKYHPVLRIGPNHLSYADGAAIKDIYGHSTKCVKDDFYSLVSGTHYNLADCVDKKQHAEKRRGLSSAYAIKNLEGWEHKVVDKVEKLIKEFDRCCGAAEYVDFRKWTNFFTMDAIADIGLSQSLGFLEAGDDKTVSVDLDGTACEVSYREVLHNNLFAQSQVVWAYDWYPQLKWLTSIFSKKFRYMWKCGRQFDGIVLHQTNKRMERYRAGEDLNDFFQALMESKDGLPRNLELGEIVAEISIMLNAGSVSTAIAINNCMFMLLKHPLAMKALREELDSVLDETDVVAAYDKVKYLPYLRACLDESMRILPPTTFNLPRKTPPEGAIIFGEYVPGNTSVSMSSYVAHRDGKAFPEPEVFRPERWLDEKGKELQQYFITFSAGARGCIGRNISYLEQLIMIASLVHRYEFELPSPDWELDLKEHFNLVPKSMPVKIWKRKL
ncbi:cytochrome P450 oxidoreductase [Lipomyces doorenjongii]